MRNLLAVAVFSVMALCAGTTQASVAPNSGPGVPAAVISAGVSGVKPAIFNAEQMMDLRGTSVLWVLGGGLVAVSLLARRRS